MLTNQSIGYMDAPVPKDIDLKEAIDKLRKEKNANFQTMIQRELFEEINAFLTERGMTKVDFIKKAFEVMQNNA